MRIRKYILISLALICIHVSAFAQDVLNPQVLSGQPAPIVIQSPAPAAVTEAEQIRNQESLFQTRLVPITTATEDISRTIADLRKMVNPPDPRELDNVEQKIVLAEQELARSAMGTTSPIAKLQESDLQDRLFSLRLSVETLKRRWGWSQDSVFGLDFFTAASPTSELDVKTAPRGYQLRTGDSVKISVSSSLGGEKEYTRELDQDGRLFVPALGKVAASGKTITQLEAALNSQYKKQFSQLSVAVSIDKMSSIVVQVAGAVVRPGSYKFTGMASVFDALYKAGGPTAAGSFRQVTLARDGAAKRVVDLYGFLVNGDKSQDVPLRDGDLLFVPPVGKTIVVYGEVVRPGRYEPTFPLSLAAAVKLAGGAKPSGFLQTVSIERVVDGEYKTLVNAKLNDLGGKSSVAVEPGDQVTVMSIKAERTNMVSISGPVNAPGPYAFSEGLRVSDLVKAAQGLSKDVEIHFRRADILRIEEGKSPSILSFDLQKALAGDAVQDVKLQKLDRVFLYVPEQVEFRTNYFTITGAVSKPGAYRRANAARASDAVAAAGGILPNAYLARADMIRHGDNNTREIIRLNLDAALQGSQKDDPLLSDRDEITVYTYDQIRSNFTTVRVVGSVQRPGLYDRADNMRVSDLLFIAGGVLPEAGGVAEVSHAQDNGDLLLTKVNVAALVPGSAADVLLNDGDVLSVPALGSALRTPMTVTVQGEVAYPGTYSIDPRKTKLADVIARAGGMTSVADTGSLVFLRRKDSLQSATQLSGLDLIAKRMASFVNKQFLVQLAQMKVTTSAQLQQELPGTLALPKNTPQVSQRELQTGTDTSAAQTKPRIEEQFSAGKDVTQSETAMGSKIDGVAISESESGHDNISGFSPDDYGRVGVDLASVLKDSGSKHNLMLKDGDIVIVPLISDTITIMGAVLHPHCFVAEEGKTMAYYIEKSGGYSPDASRKFITVVRANGDAVPAGRVRQMSPGDIIYVPNSGLIDVASKTEKIGSITKILSDILSSAFIITRF